MKRIVLQFLILFVIGYYTQMTAQVAEIPFELGDDGHIFLKVKVNNSNETLNFIFDTGATSDLLDPAIAKQYGLQPDYQQDVQGAGSTTTYDVVLNQRLILSEKVIIDQTHLVLVDLGRLNEVADETFDGIIGYSLLKKYVVQFDYLEQKLLLFERLEDVLINGYEAISFEFGQGIPIPQFDIEFALNNGDSFRGKVFFDTGAALTLLMNSPFSQRNKIAEKAVKSLISKSDNLNKTSISEEVAIKSIKIGNFLLGPLTAGIAHDEEGVSGYEEYLGILGSRIAKRFHVVLDYQSKTLFLKPNATFQSPFEFPVSGISLKRSGQEIIVASVSKQSPAYKLGIREGDQVLSINGDQSKLLVTYRRYLEEEGKVAHLKLKTPNEEMRTIKLELKRLL